MCSRTPSCPYLSHFGAQRWKIDAIVNHLTCFLIGMQDCGSDYSGLRSTAWNFIVKLIEEKHVFTWWALVVGTVPYLPLLVQSLPIPTSIWPYAMASALVEAAYFITLIHAYDRGDFLLVYPIARGAAPALLTMWATVFLGESR
jgi:hypothetical protein